MTTLRAYRSVAGDALLGDSFPIRLYHKAKRLGVWDPQAVDFARDRADWVRLSLSLIHI